MLTHAHTHKHTHTHTHTMALAHTSILIIQNLIYTPQLEQTINRDLRRRKTAAWNGKHGRSVVSKKRNVLRFDLKESREGFCRRERGRSFHVEGLKTEKEREPAVKSLVRGIWRLRVSEAEQRAQGSM